MKPITLLTLALFAALSTVTSREPTKEIMDYVYSLTEVQLPALNFYLECYSKEGTKDSCNTEAGFNIACRKNDVHRKMNLPDIIDLLSLSCPLILLSKKEEILDIKEKYMNDYIKCNNRMPGWQFRD